MSSLWLTYTFTPAWVNTVSLFRTHTYIGTHVLYTRTRAAHIPGRVPCSAVWSENIHRDDGKSQGNISFGASRKIRAGPVVIAPSWGAALFAQTTAEPLNGGPGLNQKPEHSPSLEVKREGLSASILCVFACVSLSARTSALSLAGTPSLTPMITGSGSRLVCVHMWGTECSCTYMSTGLHTRHKLLDCKSHRIQLLKGADQSNQTVTCNK